MPDKKKLSKEEKIEKAKKLMAQIKALELTEEQLKAVSGGGDGFWCSKDFI